MSVAWTIVRVVGALIPAMAQLKHCATLLSFHKNVYFQTPVCFVVFGGSCLHIKGTGHVRFQKYQTSTSRPRPRYHFKKEVFGMSTE